MNSTPHISAQKGEIAKTVLMPGDPLRSKFIAEHYLEHPVLVNNVRGVQGYSGQYHGKDVTVMASGMGMPSMRIYSHELFSFYDVDAIIRVGSAGAFSEKLKLRDLVIGMGACSDSNSALQYGLRGSFAPIADYGLVKRAEEYCTAHHLRFQIGNLLSTDLFYQTEEYDKWKDFGVLAVEMEAAALYENAARAGKRALAICTVSDHFITGEKCSSQERETSFTEMMEVALSLL